MKRFWIRAISAVSLNLAAAQSHGADAPFLIGIAGKPPVFMSVQEYVALEQGLFEKYGVHVELRNFVGGDSAERAVIDGALDLAATPTPIVVASVASSGAQVTGIYGLENPDWLIGSTDESIKTCQNLIGTPIGIDSPGGGRWTALRQMTTPPPCNLKMEQLQLVGNGVNSAAALISGALKVAVMHLDDLSEIEEKLGRPIYTVMTLKRIQPISHYDLFVARPDRLAQGRERYVRVLAGLIEAEAFMRNAKNWDRVGQIAAPTGHSPGAATAALKRYLEFEFWPNGHDGLDQRKIEAEISAFASLTGGVQGKPPPTYDSLVDPSLFQDAVALMRQTR